MHTRKQKIPPQRSNQNTMALMNWRTAMLLALALCGWESIAFPIASQTKISSCSRSRMAESRSYFSDELLPMRKACALLTDRDPYCGRNGITLVGRKSFGSVRLHYALNTIETVCVESIDEWYSKSQSIKCPFLKRRTSDVLDAMDNVMRFLIIRHKSLDLIGPPLSCRATRIFKSKCPNLPIGELADIIRKDWREDNHKGYYISGKLDTTIYRDDCLFDGPDPDMPVRGLGKYLNAASQLFDYQSSTATLKSMKIVNDRTILVKWEIEGVLHLPWYPKLPTWTGSTTYNVDDDGLIYLHEDAWDISVFQAFSETLFPQLSKRIWNESNISESDQTHR